MPTDLSPAWQRAQEWHEQQRAVEARQTEKTDELSELHSSSSCFCCCLACDPDGSAFPDGGNPHWDDAQLPDYTRD